MNLPIRQQYPIRGNPTGGSTVRAFLKAADNDPRAIQAIGDHALNGLRAKIGPLGTLAQKNVDRWSAAHAPAIQAMQEALPGFTDLVSTAAAADRTLVAAGLANRAEREAAQRLAAADALTADRARSADLSGRNAADRDNTSLAPAQRRDADKAADAADRASVGALIAERRSGDAAINARSAAGTAAGIGQARGIAKTAHATPAGQFARAAGGAVATTEVENTVGAMLNTGKAGAARMRGLVQTVESDPEALAGLRKAGADFMVQSFTNADGSVSGAKMIRFLIENRDVLAELYPHEQRTTFGALARDAENGAKWRTETAIKSGCDTAQNLHAMMGKAGEAAKHLSMMTVAAEAVGQGFEHGGVHGALLGGASAAGLYLVNGLRDAGIRHTSDLVRAALLDPKVARLLISKAPTASNLGPAHVLIGALRRAAITGNAWGTPPSPPPTQPSAPPPAAPVRRQGGALSSFLAM